jgi:hypothetical protein
MGEENRVARGKRMAWGSLLCSSSGSRWMAACVCLAAVLGYPTLRDQPADPHDPMQFVSGLNPSNDDERVVVTQIKMYRELLNVGEQTNAEFSRSRDCFASSTLALDGFKRMISNAEYRGLLLREFNAQNVDKEIMQQYGQVALEANYPRGDAGRLRFCGKDERLQLMAAQFAKHSGMWDSALRERGR